KEIFDKGIKDHPVAHAFKQLAFALLLMNIQSITGIEAAIDSAMMSPIFIFINGLLRKWIL
ncbi:MAG: hypothetical protein ACFE9D_12655, partial [Promethearchaeota archaeon]